MNIERPDRVNWSTIKAIGVSPKHYLHLLQNPRPDTDALKLGRLTHALVFEPDEINARYAVAPRFNATMNDDTAQAKGYDGGKQAKAAWLARVNGRDVIEPGYYAAAYGMAQAVRSDPIAGPIVSSGWSEGKIEWTDPVTGIECRGRVDHVNGLLADLKTTRNLVGFERDIARFGYAAQIAWYADGLAASGVSTAKEPCIIAVENVQPHDVIVLRFEPDDLAVGRRIYRKCLDRLAECRKTGFWPGISNGVSRRVVLPPWTSPIEEVELTLDGEPLT